MNYVKIILVSIICMQAVATTHISAADRWFQQDDDDSYAYISDLSSIPQYNLQLQPAPTPSSASSMFSDLMNVLTATPTPTPAPVTPATSPAAQFAHSDKKAVVAAIISVAKNMHTKGKIDAETFQAIMSNPIIVHAITSAVSAAYTYGREALRSQSTRT